jgi:hypothetical protein
MSRSAASRFGLDKIQPGNTGYIAIRKTPGYSGSPVNRSPHSTAQPKISRIQNLPITPPKIIVF